MKPVWNHVESRIKESNGGPIQPTGMWEKDYGVLLEELVKAEQTKEEETLREKEQAERSKAQASDEGWETVVEKFTQRGIPGIRVTKGQDPFSISAVLSKAGIVFSIEGIQEPDNSVISEWKVSSQVPQGRPPSKLENAIQDCLDSRARKWDLTFLLVRVS